jgi:hypothetical protein
MPWSRPEKLSPPCAFKTHFNVSDCFLKYTGPSRSVGSTLADSTKVSEVSVHHSEEDIAGRTAKIRAARKQRESI